MTRVLVVDDSQETCDLLELLLGDGKDGPGVEVVKATRPEEAIRHLQAGGFDLMLSDINLEASQDGLDLLRVAKPLGVETILLTGFGTLEKALEAVREGAFDFISKPWNNEELKSLVKRAIVMKESKEGRRPACNSLVVRRRRPRGHTSRLTMAPCPSTSIASSFAGWMPKV